MKKALHIITGLDDGGAEGVLYRMCTFGPSSYNHVVISLTSSGKYGPLLEQQGIVVHVLNMPRSILSLAKFLRLVKLTRHEKPDVIQTWMYHADLLGGLAGRLAGIRNVCWGVRHSTFESRPSLLTALVLNACAMVSRYIPKVIVCCAHEAIKAHRSLGYSGRFVVIPNGYNMDNLFFCEKARSEFAERQGIPDDYFLLGCVARFNPQKDHASLLYALSSFKRKCQKFVCIFVGKDCTPENKVLTNKIDKLGLNKQVLLLGQRADIPHVMSALDLHVLTSAYGEAFPNVVAEAMGCGTPCVVTDVGDAARIVLDDGWVVPCKDISAIARAFEKAFYLKNNQQEAWLKLRSRCALSINERYSLAHMVEQFEEVWSRGR